MVLVDVHHSGGEPSRLLPRHVLRVPLEILLILLVVLVLSLLRQSCTITLSALPKRSRHALPWNVRARERYQKLNEWKEG